MPGIERRSKSSPCRYCLDRYPACSDHCKKPEFLAWKAEQETIRGEPAEVLLSDLETRRASKGAETVNGALV